MSETTNNQTDQLSEDQLSEVAGGASNTVQQQRLDSLDTGTKSIDNIQEARLGGLDDRDKK